MQKDEASAKSTPESFGLFRHKREYKERKTRITIKNSGAYKLGLDEKERNTLSAAQ